MTSSIDETATRGTARRGGRRIARLTVVDRMFLHAERPAWPCHFGGLAVIDGRALLDESGQLQLEEVRDRLARRLAQIPDLRQRIHAPGWLSGGPLWVDDPRFSIEHHVHEAAVPAPGGDGELLEAAARAYEGLLDRRRPLWELWFLTGLRDGRVGILLKLHHAVADGPAAVAIMASLFDIGRNAPDPVAAPFAPEPIPGARTLLAANVASKLRTLGRGLAALAHPLRTLGAARVFALVMRRAMGQQAAPRTSLNSIVRVGRRVRVVHLDLAEMKDAAHTHGGKLNDVFLDLFSGGLRQLLVSRGELVEGIELKVAQAVSLRSPSEAEAIDNQAGSIVLPLPVGEADPGLRLDRIVATTSRTKAIQRPAAIMNAMAAMDATPLGQYLNLHQRAVNVIATNVVGPPVPMYVLGAPILDILPIIQLVGNIGLTLAAFSYAGRVSLVVTADASGFPDVDQLILGMERDWQALSGTRPAAPEPEREPATTPEAVPA
ncbi:MAG TPA: wax ester/triacylglycerol synthase family O-acyltransferase [Candidatus Limnocylindrales bacterium]|nr:wax ester/triacylglycerol synthase family O-acyltransferase [Candidatus Limnocylindrales bacterium]